MAAAPSFAELLAMPKEALAKMVVESRQGAAPSSAATPGPALQVGAPSPQQPGGKSAAGKSKGGKGKQREYRDFDMSKYPQRHVALKVAYLGQAYDGLAFQEIGCAQSDVPTSNTFWVLGLASQVTVGFSHHCSNRAREYAVSIARGGSLSSLCLTHPRKRSQSQSTQPL